MDVNDINSLLRSNSILSIGKYSLLKIYKPDGTEIKVSDSLESLNFSEDEKTPYLIKEDSQINKRIAFLFVSLICANMVIWVASVGFYSAYSRSSIPLLLIAYTLGLRHALDADHIAAIDNTTRRFILNGETPVTLGLFFSLGHSTIVIFGTIVVAVVANTVFVQNYNQVSGLIGSSFSASFLLLIGIINSVSVYYLLVTIKNYKRNKLDEDLNELETQGGIFSRLFGIKLFRLVDKPWKMYIIGFLFGLGFDTATEIALISIVVINASSGGSWIVLFLSFLFTCGMTIVDSIDAVLMLKIYGWDLVSPFQKLIFNLFITTLSVIFAFGIALVELLGIVQSQYNPDGPFWDFIANAGENFEFIGVFILGTFIGCFIFAFAIMRLAAKKPNFGDVNESNIVATSSNS